jgi:hypothetical protein
MMVVPRGLFYNYHGKAWMARHLTSWLGSACVRYSLFITDGHFECHGIYMERFRLERVTPCMMFSVYG